MSQVDVLPWLNALVAVLLSGNIFFIKRLVEKVEATLEAQRKDLHDLQIKFAILHAQINAGRNTQNERDDD